MTQHCHFPFLRLSYPVIQAMAGFFLSDLKRDKLAIILSFCAAIGWLVFVAGFGKHEHGIIFTRFPHF
jgi:hypothetical protein